MRCAVMVTGASSAGASESVYESRSVSEADT